jgi:hypothetical protein
MKGIIVKLTAYWPGEPDVGIPGGSAELDLGDYWELDEYCREATRAAFWRFIEKWVADEGPLTVVFSDECIECGASLGGCDEPCVTPDCPCNPDTYDKS